MLVPWILVAITAGKDGSKSLMLKSGSGRTLRGLLLREILVLETSVDACVEFSLVVEVVVLSFEVVDFTYFLVRFLGFKSC